MRRISGGAVWSNRPCTDLARASVEQLAGATLPTQCLLHWTNAYERRTNPQVGIMPILFVRMKFRYSFIMNLNRNLFLSTGIVPNSAPVH